MKYITVEEAARKWDVSARSVQIHCQKGNISGVNLQGKSWMIPADAEKPKRKPRAKGRQARLKDTCGTGQDVFKLGLKSFGYSHLIKEGEL